MSRKVPIIKIHDCLLVSIQIELSDKIVSELKDDICGEITKRNVSGLIIEVSGVDILDSYIARSIRDLVQVSALMGVQSWIVGLDPSMAITLVEMDMILGGVSTALNLETALDKLVWKSKGDRPSEEDHEDLFDYLQEAAP